MRTVELSENVLRLLEEPFLGEGDLNSKLYNLLRAEYLRRLNYYRRVDYRLRQKYGMSFEEFMGKRMLKEYGYTWEVETDAMEWETAISGIKTIERKLRELKEAPDADEG